MCEGEGVATEIYCTADSKVVPEECNVKVVGKRGREEEREEGGKCSRHRTKRRETERESEGGRDSEM